MTVALTDERVRRLRLAAQRLTPSSAAVDVREAAGSVLGVQAQDVRAASLALRSRTPSVDRAGVEGSPLVRTWTVRGTAHLVDPEDLPLFDAVTGSRNRARFTTLLDQRGGLEIARGMREDVVAILSETPLDRAALLTKLAARGHPALVGRAVNVLMPWLAVHGVVAGLPDGRYRAAQPSNPPDAEGALATLAARYLAGYAPASARDLAHWSGLPVTLARQALAALGGLDTAGDLSALPGTFDTPVPPAPPALLLAAFDTSMLGHHTREPLVAAQHDRRVLPGGGMLRPVVLIDGVAAGTWGTGGPGRTVTIDWFDGPRGSAELDAERAAVERFLT